MEPFENGWAKRKAHGELYGVRYIHQYEEELTKMFEIGVRNSANKMSAGKMRENLMNKYPGRFSIPGETDIKQFIGKLSQKGKKQIQSKTGNNKSAKGGKPGHIKQLWQIPLSELVKKNPTEKPEVIYDNFIKSFGDELPDDLPKDSNDKPDKQQIKSTIARIKTNHKKNAKRSIIV